MPSIGASDRVLAVGQTGSGKSVWLQAQARQLIRAGGQVLEIDVKGDDDIGGERQRVHYDPKRIKWDEHQVISYVPKDGGGDREELEKLFDAAWDIRGLTILLHESIGPTGPNTWPRSLNRILVQGRSRGVRIWAGSQRPVGFAPNLRMQADHIILFARRYAPRDLQELSMEMAFDNARDLQRELELTNRRYGDKGKFAHLWWERDTGDVYRMPPMPEWMLP